MWWRGGDYCQIDWAPSMNWLLTLLVCHAVVEFFFSALERTVDLLCYGCRWSDRIQTQSYFLKVYEKLWPVQETMV